MIYTPPIEQSDWSECYNHGTNIYISLQQVCLMSQSWDNVASMHDHLLIVHAHKI